MTMLTSTYACNHQSIGVQGKMPATDGRGAKTGDSIVITKNGRPVARLIPEQILTAIVQLIWAMPHHQLSQCAIERTPQYHPRSFPISRMRPIIRKSAAFRCPINSMRSASAASTWRSARLAFMLVIIYCLLLQ
ncbi:MAG: type II toxin-antitoxin system prevent-host-death family antitoxin, partial [Chromatiales bacterium]|nr:type II toxin-antitoxin system prevent-host-death family antitoxin [Chromatiales bacterium]